MRRRPRRPAGCRRSSAYRRATPTTVGSCPSSASSRSAGPFNAAPAMMGDTATTSRRRATSSSARPGTANKGPIETIGLDGHTTTTSAPATAASTPGAGTAILGSSNRTASTATAWRRPTKYSWNETSGPSTSVSRVRTGSSDIGTRRTGTPRAAVISDGDLGQGRALRQALGAVQVGGEVVVSQAEPGLAPEPLEAVHHLPRLPGEAPAALVVVQARQGVGHGVEVGADAQAVELGVVARVDHRRDVGGRHDAHQAAQETGGTYSSCEGGDHGARLTVRARAPGARCARLDRCRRTRHPTASASGWPSTPRRFSAPEPEWAGSVPVPCRPWPCAPSSKWTPSPSPGAGGSGCPPSCRPASIVRQRAMPARPLHLAWSHLPGPAVEWFVGGVDVVHGTNFVVPPSRRAARVVTVHDLTMVRFPELCDRAIARISRAWSAEPCPPVPGCTHLLVSWPTRW